MELLKSEWRGAITSFVGRIGRKGIVDGQILIDLGLHITNGMINENGGEDEDSQ